ncbi:MAG: folate-binding protein [Betaproteobacteria bacterium]|nr:folate-binding protein [Betaproteobacteria bacterium]
MNPASADFLASHTSTPGGPSLPSLFNDITQFSVLRVTGAGAGAFLQGQLTCDVLGLAFDRWTWGAYCSAKGRVLANFLLWASGDAYRIVLPQALASGIAKRLRMFVLRSKVVIEDERDSTVLLGIRFGEDATLLATLGLLEPWTEFALTRQSTLEVLWLRDGRALIAAPARDAKIFLAAMQGKGHLEPAAHWDSLAIAQGEPWVQPQTQDAFVPQMLNLEILGGISFTKGCYPGQEIVARSQHLGQVKRRLFRYGATPGEAIAPGSPIFSQDGAVVGTVINAVPGAQGTTELLAVLQTPAQGEHLHLGSAQGPLLEPRPLPYTVPGQGDG